jgi:transposase
LAINDWRTRFGHLIVILRVPEVARACLAALGNQLLSLKEQIVEFDRMIMVWHRSNETSKRLHYIPGVGPMSG